MLAVSIPLLSNGDCFISVASLIIKFKLQYKFFRIAGVGVSSYEQSGEVKLQP